MTSMLERDPRLIADEPGLKGLLISFRRRIGAGELGSVPVIVGLVVIWIYLQSQNSNFLTARNFTNLLLQIAATGTIAVGITMVLLLGEIDLSVGSVSGLAAAVTVVMNVKHGVDPVLAVVIGLAVGAAIGAFQGSVFAFFAVPSFVVTLAGLIAWQGEQLNVLGETGTVNLQFGKGISRLTTTFYGRGISYTIAAVLVLLFVLTTANSYRRQRSAGLETLNVGVVAVRTVIIAVAAFVVVAVLDRDRGLPLAVIIFVGFVLIFNYVQQNTLYGRHIFAVGGNIEAARRAGINIRFIRVSVFALSGFMAAAGGILAASRLTAVNQSSGGGDILLNAIAAAVIGGTSLFGGRGSAYSALLGMLVIGSIANGLDLLNKSSATKFVITGAVLLIAATIDALARRGRVSAGRA